MKHLPRSQALAVHAAVELSVVGFGSTVARDTLATDMAVEHKAVVAPVAADTSNA